MRRLLRTHRWELWLLIGIPVVSNAVLFSSVYWIDFHFEVAALTTAVLLGVSYPRVKRLGRDFFTLVWGYALAAAIIAAAIRVVWVNSPIDLGAPLTNVLSYGRWGALGEYDGTADSLLLWHMKWAAVREFAVLPALMVFAWRASRFSLAHAYFLFLIAQTYRITWVYAITPPLDPYSGPPSVLAHAVLVSIVTLAPLLVLVGLLRNFELRGPQFHWLAVAALAAAWVLLPIADGFWSSARDSWTEVLVYALRSPVLLSSAVLFTVLPLAVIYLVRARGTHRV